MFWFKEEIGCHLVFSFFVVPGRLSEFGHAVERLRFECVVTGRHIGERLVDASLAMIEVLHQSVVRVCRGTDDVPSHQSFVESGVVDKRSDVELSCCCGRLPQQLFDSAPQSRIEFCQFLVVGHGIHHLLDAIEHSVVDVGLERLFRNRGIGIPFQQVFPLLRAEIVFRLPIDDFLTNLL